MVVYHWTTAELAFNGILNSHKERFKKLLQFVSQKLVFVDLYDYFHSESIVIQGQLDFSLKSVLKALNLHGLSSLTYENSTIKDGKQAMVAWYRGHESPDVDPTITNEHIVKYNTVDVLGLSDILDFLRSI